MSKIYKIPFLLTPHIRYRLYRWKSLHFYSAFPKATVSLSFLILMDSEQSADLSVSHAHKLHSCCSNRHLYMCSQLTNNFVKEAGAYDAVIWCWHSDKTSVKGHWTVLNHFKHTWFPSSHLSCAVHKAQCRACYTVTSWHAHFFYEVKSPSSPRDWPAVGVRTSFFTYP